MASLGLGLGASDRTQLTSHQSNAKATMHSFLRDDDLWLGGLGAYGTPAMLSALLSHERKGAGLELLTTDIQ